MRAGPLHWLKTPSDIYSLALTAVSRLLNKYFISPTSVGRLEVGTETLLDKSKSVKTVLMQLFQDTNTNIEGIDTVNACYGGTSALFNAINWIESSSWDGRLAIVVAGDIAIYDKGAARPTGGAGCVAMLVGPDAPIVIEAGRGSHFRHAYDFYKPDFSKEYPTVDGQLSLRCYTEALDSCYKAYQASTKRTAATNSSGESFSNGIEENLKRKVVPGSLEDDLSQDGELPQTNRKYVKDPPTPPSEDSGDIMHRIKLQQETNTDSLSSALNGSSTTDTSTSLPIDTFDYMCFHAPTTKTVAKSYARLVYNDYLSHPQHSTFSQVPSTISTIPYEASLADKTIEKTFQSLSDARFTQKVKPATFVPTQCGNMYTASLYSGLCSLLSLVESEDLQDKRIGMFSYGSGLASTMFALRVVASTEGIKENLGLMEMIEGRIVATPSTYDVVSHVPFLRLMNRTSIDYLGQTCGLRELAYQRKSYSPVGDVDRLAKGTYYLVHVDDKARRTYAVKQ